MRCVWEPPSLPCRNRIGSKVLSLDLSCLLMGYGLGVDESAISFVYSPMSFTALGRGLVNLDTQANCDSNRSIGADACLALDGNGEELQADAFAYMSTHEPQ